MSSVLASGAPFDSFRIGSLSESRPIAPLVRSTGPADTIPRPGAVVDMATVRDPDGVLVELVETTRMPR
jgi:hypothetical protein